MINFLKCFTQTVIIVIDSICRSCSSEVIPVRLQSLAALPLRVTAVGKDFVLSSNDSQDDQLKELYLYLHY